MTTRHRQRNFVGGGRGVFTVCCCWPACIGERRPGLAVCETHALRVWTALDEERNGTPEKPPAKPKPPRDRMGVVYYLLVGDRIKVGFASDLERRLRAYPPGTHLLACHPGTLSDEKAAHQRFTPWRVAGREWYENNPSIRKHIAEIDAAEHARLMAMPVPDPGPRPGT